MDVGGVAEETRRETVEVRYGVDSSGMSQDAVLFRHSILEYSGD